ncbi:MAG TPA: SRPBCC domain-containing protein, partial [Cyclobacteriaceae bacterium]
VTYCKLDVREGGNWRAGIVNGDGDQSWMEGKFIEIVEGKRLVFTFNDGSEFNKTDLETVVTIVFSKSGNQTIMNFKQSVFKTVEVRDSHYGGWSGAFNCLRDHINKSK